MENHTVNDDVGKGGKQIKREREQRDGKKQRGGWVNAYVSRVRVCVIGAIGVMGDGGRLSERSCHGYLLYLSPKLGSLFNLAALIFAAPGSSRVSLTVQQSRSLHLKSVEVRALPC